MRIATKVWVAAMAIAAVASSASAAELSGAPTPGPAKEEDSAQAQIWFERAPSLDIGAAGAPDAVQAFTAMRHAAESGHTQAAFNVAVMLDSGHGAPRDVVQAAIWYARAAAGGNRRAAFNLGQLYESGEGVPANVDLSRAWYAAADLPAAREHLAETRSAAVRPAIVQAPEPLFPTRKSLLAPGLQQVDLVWSSPLEPEAVRFFVELRILEAVLRARSGAGLSTLAACAYRSPRALRIWLGASLRWREARRAIPCPAGRPLRSLRRSVHRAAVALAEVRGRLSQGLRRRPRGCARHC